MAVLAVLLIGVSLWNFIVGSWFMGFVCLLLGICVGIESFSDDYY